MTYKELKLFSMQKMFHDITEITKNSVTKPYLDKMPYVASCAVMRVASLGFAKKKSIQIAKLAVKNEIKTKNDVPYTVVSKDVIFKGSCGKAYYFEACGCGKALIYVGESIVKTIVFNTDKIFEKFKGKFENLDFSEVKIVFVTGEPYIVRNPAIYNADFANDSDVCENSEYISYDLKELIDDFYCFDTSRFVDEKCNCNVNSFYFEKDSIIRIKSNVTGSWNVPYLAYPIVINSNTSDDAIIDLPYELCMILPFYIASELYLEDDSALAVGWRNKFETSLSEYSTIRNRSAVKKAEVVTFKEGAYGEF